MTTWAQPERRPVAASSFSRAGQVPLRRRPPRGCTPAPRAGFPPPAAARLGHDFGRVRVHTAAGEGGAAARLGRRPAPAGGKRGEAFPGDDIGAAPGSRLKRTDTTGALVGGGIGGALGAVVGGLVGGPVGALIGAGIGGLAGGLIGNAASGPGARAAGTPSLALSNDTYSDNATESRKNVQFDVTIPAGHKATDYALVNWVKGSMKDGSGTYFKAKMYGSVVDANYSSWVVDSVDADPIYWSDASGRWNYRTTPSGFYATDSPGPALSTELGAVYALNFRIGLYKLSDLPATTSGTIGGATAIAERPWQYSVVVDPRTGAFTHPAI